MTFRYAGDEPDPRTALAAGGRLSAEDAVALDAALEVMDRRNRHGAWTRATRAAIEQQPPVAAARIAAALGRERVPLQADVRKLKRLGLTISLDSGYEWSPRGRAVLRHSEAQTIR